MRISRKSAKNIQVWLKSNKNNAHFTWRRKCTFDHSLLNSSSNDKFSRRNYRENQNKILRSINFLWKSLRLRNNLEKYDADRQLTDESIIRRMLIACYITKATNIQKEYVIILAFSGQEWLRKRASLLHYTHIACHIMYYLDKWQTSRYPEFMPCIYENCCCSSYVY